jgi:hypothetical protein
LFHDCAGAKSGSQSAPAAAVFYETGHLGENILPLREHKILGKVHTVFGAAELHYTDFAKNQLRLCENLLFYSNQQRQGVGWLLGQEFFNPGGSWQHQAFAMR